MHRCAPATGPAKIHRAAPWHLPVVLKDNLDAIGRPMTNASKLEKLLSAHDSPLVAKQGGGRRHHISQGLLNPNSPRAALKNINSVLPGFRTQPVHTAYATVAPQADPAPHCHPVLQ